MKYNDKPTAFPTKKGYFSTFKSKCIKLSYHLKLSHAKTCAPKRFCSGKRDLWIICCLCFVFVLFSWLFIVALWSSAGKGLTSWLSFICCFIVYVSLSHVVSFQGYGARLYQFLIFAFFLTYITTSFKNKLLTC